ncbi:ABC transporter permease [Aeromicrobium sp. Root236]|uniref:ABC transporter permease n=1 Tax=Aeromicrobium sp. Root236 TaxID=1736498 RepID=UPI00070233C1|nr:ABC transporter permease [Aeromicrobium sp. Root236]KRC64168.1 ABC transporter permease [Aeromicrobium sp. Root236]
MRAARRWVGEHLILGLGLLILIYTFVPIAVVVLMSFNDSSKSRNVYKFQKFTMDHWLHPGSWADGMGGSVWLSIQIAFWATLVATIIGTLAAFALVRHRFAGRSAANVIIFLPMASPEIVMGSSLLALFVSMQKILPFGLGFWTILIAHVMFCLSFVIVTVKARLSGLNDNLEQAAMDLYATESQTFWRVTFPLVLPGIIGAALLSFSLSFDDFIITNLNAGQEVTFPMFVYGANQRGVPMEVNVIGTAMFVISIIIVVGNEIRRRSQEKALAA